MAVPETIQPLVDKYTFHRDAYIRGQEKYNEAQLRQDFTDPFFHASGWNVNNSKGDADAGFEQAVAGRLPQSREYAAIPAGWGGGCGD